jgi:CRISPR-associated protein (TIGR02710 family)
LANYPSRYSPSVLCAFNKCSETKKCFFLGTHEFRNQFLAFIINKTHLKRKNYIVHAVDYDNLDIATVYGIIKENLNLFEHKKVLVDLSRGKRVLTAAAGVMASFNRYDLAYIDEDWEDAFKRGLPGSEKLLKVKNPFDVFGDLEDKYAVFLFNLHSYNAAASLYKSLCEKVYDPRKFEVKRMIAEAYDHWDAFNYIVALKILEKAFEKIDQYQLSEYRQQIAKNNKVLKLLTKFRQRGENRESLQNEKLILHILIDIFLNAERRFSTNRCEDGIARLYRICELVSQHRLSKYGVNTAKPDYSHIKITNEEYRKTTKKIYGYERDLPPEILKDGHMILFLLKDEIWKNSSIADLKKLFDYIRVRDFSIIAHGFEILSPKAFKNFEGICKKFMNTISKTACIDLNEVIENNSFLKF